MLDAAMENRAAAKAVLLAHGVPLAGSWTEARVREVESHETTLRQQWEAVAHDAACVDEALRALSGWQAELRWAEHVERLAQQADLCFASANMRRMLRVWRHVRNNGDATSVLRAARRLRAVSHQRRRALARGLAAFDESLGSALRVGRMWLLSRRRQCLSAIRRWRIAAKLPRQRQARAVAHWRQLGTAAAWTSWCAARAIGRRREALLAHSRTVLRLRRLRRLRDGWRAFKAIHASVGGTRRAQTQAMGVWAAKAAVRALRALCAATAAERRLRGATLRWVRHALARALRKWRAVARRRACASVLAWQTTQRATGVALRAWARHVAARTPLAAAGRRWIAQGRRGAFRWWMSVASRRRHARWAVCLADLGCRAHTLSKAWRTWGLVHAHALAMGQRQVASACARLRCSLRAWAGAAAAAAGGGGLARRAAAAMAHRELSHGVRCWVSATTRAAARAVAARRLVLRRVGSHMYVAFRLWLARVVSIHQVRRVQSHQRRAVARHAMREWALASRVRLGALALLGRVGARERRAAFARALKGLFHAQLTWLRMEARGRAHHAQRSIAWLVSGWQAWRAWVGARARWLGLRRRHVGLPAPRRAMNAWISLVIRRTTMQAAVLAAVRCSARGATAAAIDVWRMRRANATTQRLAVARWRKRAAAAAWATWYTALRLSTHRLVRLTHSMAARRARQLRDGLGAWLAARVRVRVAWQLAERCAATWVAAATAAAVRSLRRAAAAARPMRCAVLMWAHSALACALRALRSAASGQRLLATLASQTHAARHRRLRWVLRGWRAEAHRRIVCHLRGVAVGAWWRQSTARALMVLRDCLAAAAVRSASSEHGGRVRGRRRRLAFQRWQETLLHQLRDLRAAAIAHWRGVALAHQWHVWTAAERAGRRRWTVATAVHVWRQHRGLRRAIRGWGSNVQSRRTWRRHKALAVGRWRARVAVASLRAWRAVAVARRAALQQLRLLHEFNARFAEELNASQQLRQRMAIDAKPLSRLPPQTEPLPLATPDPGPPSKGPSKDGSREWGAPRGSLRETPHLWKARYKQEQRAGEKAAQPAVDSDVGSVLSAPSSATASFTPHRSRSSVLSAPSSVTASRHREGTPCSPPLRAALGLSTVDRTPVLRPTAIGRSDLQSRVHQPRIWQSRVFLSASHHLGIFVPLTNCCPPPLPLCLCWQRRPSLRTSSRPQRRCIGRCR